MLTSRYRRRAAPGLVRRLRPRKKIMTNLKGTQAKKMLQENGKVDILTLLKERNLTTNTEVTD
jgi:hypothetical protein